MLRRVLLVATVLLLIVPAGTAVASGPPSFVLPALDLPVQASDVAPPGSPSFKLPDGAPEVAPGVFFLGYAVEDGAQLEGYAYARRADAKPPKEDKGNPGKGGGGGGTVDPASCYSYIAGGSAWVTIEPYLFNPANDAGISIITSDTDSAFGRWETAVGEKENIVNDGSAVTDELTADTSSPDTFNEIYFADITDENVLGYTIVWSTRSRGPFVGQIVEADMVIDNGWNWYTGAVGGDIQGNKDEPFPEIDFWGVFTHEAGHWVGMGHTDTVTECEGQTMYPSVSYGDDTKRTLGLGDEAGVLKLYS